MGHTVVIEGSRTPCVDLPAGERRTVEVDDRVRRRVALGYYLVVGGNLDEASEVAAPDPVELPSDSGSKPETAQVNTDSDIPAKDASGGS